jgi:hypothetical protein
MGEPAVSIFRAPPILYMGSVMKGDTTLAHGTGIKTLGESPKMGMSFCWKHKSCAWHAQWSFTLF